MAKQQLGLRLRYQACSACRRSGHNIRRHRRAAARQLALVFG